jgi:lipid-A-disaccharide synthase
VAGALRLLRPDLELLAVGGPRLAEQGVELIHRDHQLGVMGFLEVLRHVPRHFQLLRNIRSMLNRGEISLVILIDYPGFNMKVAAAAKAAKVPVLYYVTPQVWAWGAGRIPKLAQLVSKAAVILPFEEKLLRGYGIDATFVGHPLLDRARNMPTRQEAREALELSQNGKVLALFPGSRQQEIDRHIEDFVATAKLLQERIRGLEVIVSVAPTVALDARRCPFRLVHSASLSVLRAADAGLCKSGTTTLEASIADCPLVVAYRTGRISYALAKRLQRWRATVARRDGALVSMNVAPPTRTRSVVKNRALAAAYAGAHRFGVQVFEPTTSNVLMAALLVHDLNTGGGPVHEQPWEDEAYAAAHGGLWRIPYAPRSVLGLAALVGVGAARS